MIFKSLLTFAFSLALLSGCSNHSGTGNTGLKTEIYQGYWAMHPINGQYRVLKFHQNGMVKIYDYGCNPYGGNYRLNEVETVYLRKIKENFFTLLDDKKNPFAKFEILSLNAKTMRARQSFDAERPLILNYTNITGAKPLCD